MSRTFTLLTNPASGRGDALEVADAVAAILVAAGARAQVVPSPGADGIGGLAAAAVSQGDVVVPVGGDGMVQSVAGAVAAADGAIGIVAAGSGNDFARMLGLPRTSPAEMADVLLNGVERSVDLLRYSTPSGGDRVVAGSVYAGLDERATRVANGMHRVPRKLKYPVAGLRTILSYRPDTFEVTIDGETRTHLASGVVVANSGYYGGGMHIAPAADVRDGQLDLVVIDAANRRRLISSLPKVYSGAHADLPGVHMLRGTKVSLRATAPDGGPVPVGGDGEPIGELPLLTSDAAIIEILPAALRVICPAS